MTMQLTVDPVENHLANGLKDLWFPVLPSDHLGEKPVSIRRLGYKIEVPALSAEHYETVFRQTCATYGVAFDAAAFAFLLQRHARGQTPLLACYPRDLIRQVRDLARYEGTAVRLDEVVLDWAWNNYFAVAGDSHGAQAKAAQERREQKPS